MKENGQVLLKRKLNYIKKMYRTTVDKLELYINYKHSTTLCANYLEVTL